MSSFVDSSGPEKAIEAPYAVGSKSRREADPWWEIDLGSSHNIHSLSFGITGAVQIEMQVYVVLLTVPIGHEDPFLQNMIDNANGTTVTSKEFVLPLRPSATVEYFTWELPQNSTTICRAVRIQMKALHTLQLYKVAILEGDTKLPVTAEDR